MRQGFAPHNCRRSQSGCCARRVGHVAAFVNRPAIIAGDRFPAPVSCSARHWRNAAIIWRRANIAIRIGEHGWARIARWLIDRVANIGDVRGKMECDEFRLGAALGHFRRPFLLAALGSGYLNAIAISAPCRDPGVEGLFVSGVECKRLDAVASGQAINDRA